MEIKQNTINLTVGTGIHAGIETAGGCLCDIWITFPNSLNMLGVHKTVSTIITTQFAFHLEW